MQVLCGQCGRTIDTDDLSAGSSIACAHCGRKIIVPAMDASAAVADAVSEEGFADAARAAMERKIRVICGKCGRGLVASTRFAGKQVTCPACQAEIHIPSPSEEEERLLDEFIGGENGAAVDVFEPQVIAEGNVSTPEDDEVPVLTESMEVTEETPKPLAVVSAPAFPGAHAQPSMGNEPTTPVQEKQPADLLTPNAPPAKASSEDSSFDGTRTADIPVAGGKKTLLLVAIPVVLLLVCGAAWFFLKSGTADSPPSDAAITPTAQPTPAPTKVAMATPSPVPTPALTPTAAPTPVVPSGPPVIMTLMGTKLDFFTADGFYPARPGMIYWLLTVGLDVHAKKVRLATFGDDVTLLVPKDGDTDAAAGQPERDKYASLGLQPKDQALPVRAVKKDLSLKEGEQATLTFVFEVPENTRSGILVLRGIDQVEITAVMPLPEVPAGALAGTFVEDPPRNLQVASDDPFIRAVQELPNGTVQAKARAQSVAISLPGTGIAGTAKFVSPGLYQADLKKDEHALRGHIRMISSTQMIVYFSDKPFSQMTYRKKE